MDTSGNSLSFTYESSRLNLEKKYNVDLISQLDYHDEPDHDDNILNIKYLTPMNGYNV